MDTTELVLPDRLPILYEDDLLIAINKPHGLLVHRSPIATNTDVYALQLVRDQIGTHVDLCHRLDRKTSGVLLFAKEKSALTSIAEQFSSRQTDKKYVAIVRGHTPDTATIDTPLVNDNGVSQEALTTFTTTDRTTVDIPLGKFPTSRYSLLEVTPTTGRTHQIRKHLTRINHPIIGDRPHGCSKQNRMFIERWNMRSMMLHAETLSFKHPTTNQLITISAPRSNVFLNTQKLLFEELKLIEQ